MARSETTSAGRTNAASAFNRIPLRLGQAIFALLLPVAFVIAFFVVPLLYVLLVSFVEKFPGGSLTAFTLDNYSTLSRSFYLDYIVTTVSYGLQVTGISLLVGYPLAYYMIRRGGIEYQLILIAVITPLLVGVVPRTVGWTILLGVDGIFNKSLQGLGLTDEPLQFLYTENAAVVGMVHVLLPFMVMSIASVLSGVNPVLHEAASSLGASRIQRFWRITFPLSVPGVAVGCALVFCLAVGAYITPVVLGGGKLRLMAPLAYEQFLSVVNWPLGSAVSVALILIALAVVVGVPALASRLSKRR